MGNRFLYFLVLLLGFSSCIKEESPVVAPQRVLLVYVGTDNNLGGYEQEKLDGLRNALNITANDKIIAYVDSRGGEARLIEISNLTPNEQPRRIATYGTENSASAEVFARVVRDVRTLYPNAQSRGLLVFSHASGWLPEGAFLNPYRPANTRSLMQDGSNEMSISDFAAAIPDREFDYIAFEMCFMAGIEVAYELRNKADYILASSAEIVHPGFAPIYATATAQLLAANVQGFGQSVFAQVLTYAPQTVEHSATFSVIRTSELEPLAAFVRENCDFSQAVDPAEIQHFDRNAYHLFFDFEQYHARLLSSEKRATLSQLIDRAVVWRAATPEFMTQQSTYNGFAVRSHSGLTTYLRQPQFAALNAEYSKLMWARATE